MKYRKLLKPLLLILSIGLLTSCNKKENELRNEDDKVLKVEIGTAKIEETTAGSYYIGTIEASEQVPLSFPVPGTLEKVYAEEGQMVGKGQKLAELISTTFKSSLKLAETQEKQAKDAFDRLAKVYKEGSLPEIKYVEIESKLQQAISMRQIAEKNLNDCILKSPISGVIGRKNAEPGANVMPSNPIMTIFKIDRVMAKIAIPENELTSIKFGTKAQIKIAALGDEVFTGTVKEVSMVANIISHTYDAKILIQNPGNKLKPGMVCNVSLDNQKAGIAISLPNNVILSENNQKFVYVLNSDNKSVSRRIVEIGNFVGNNIIIRSGITTDDKIIVVGQQMLYENANVKVVH